MPKTNLALLVILGGIGGALTVGKLVPQMASPAIALISAAFSALLFLIGYLLVRRHPGRPGQLDDPRRPVATWFLPAVVAGFAAEGLAVRHNNAWVDVKDSLGIDADIVLDLLLYSPPGEEVLKGCAVALVLGACVRLRRPIEAVPIGIAVGCGFEMVENSLFIGSGAVDNLDADVTGALTTIIQRASALPLSHSLYTGIAAWGVGQFLCRTDRPLGRRLAALGGWFLLAIGLHVLHNSGSFLAQFGPAGGIAMLFLVILFPWVVAVWLYLRSRKIGRRQLPANAASEIDGVEAETAPDDVFRQRDLV